jgi:competence protein ComFC
VLEPGYRSDETAETKLVEAATTFIRRWGVQPSIIVPVPPTRTYRKLQPVARLADSLGARLKVTVVHEAIRRQKQFAELKNVYDAEQRRKLLEGAFDVNASRVKGQHVLLVDDLYRSGATMNAIAEALRRSGATTVFAFAFTQTRSRI